ncbi:prolyl oligopeptidase family serine peptidase [Streptomyces sp. NPDC047315]|uniref:S9 family peptidase n=1 Tax=Streptomyces sp. NPDC047315 TaxID=3155142 RepID=UPI0033DCAE0F
MPENASAPLAFPDFPRLFARTRRFSLGVPAHLTVSPDGARVLFVRGTSGTDPVRRLWLYEDGEERVIADPLLLQGGEDDVPEAERTRRERARIRTTGVVSYATDAEASLVVFTLGGALWAVRTDGGAPWPVATAGPAVDPRPSPDGSWIAYVTDGALRAVRPDGTQDLLLASPESPEVTYGLADHTAAESIGRSRGHWWSPAGDAVLAARVDTGPVRTWYVGDPADPQRPPRAVRYPVVGTANALTSLHVLRLDGSGTRVLLPAAADAEHPVAGAWTDPAFEYVTAAGWDASGPLVSVQSRDQRSLHLLAVDPATGATTVLQRVRDGVWVDVVPGAPGRTAAGTPLAVVTDGDVPGLRIGAVATPAGLHVRDVLATAGDRVWFTANDEPTEVHVWSYDPEHGFARVSTEPGVHSAAVGGDTVVLDSLLESGPSVTVLRGGEQVGRIRVLAEEPEVTPAPQLLRLGERELRSLLFLPSGHRPGARRLPVLLCPYGGAGLQLAVRARDWWWSVAQWFAEQGFAVLITDGRGTPGRGRTWAREVHGDRLTLAVQDQVDAVHAAAERFPDLDLGTVGIRGWSYGGYLAAAAVLLRPDVFHAAVAGAVPADRRLYDTHWEERFLGHPGVVPEVYDRNSLMTYADRLVRPLLLVHGVADDNVHVAHALRLSSALLAAGREHSVLPLSGASHMVTDEEQAGNLLRQELSFLKKSLKV